MHATQSLPEVDAHKHYGSQSKSIRQVCHARSTTYGGEKPSLPPVPCIVEFEISRQFVLILLLEDWRVVS